MIDFFWLFVGIFVGLLVVSVFTPPPRKMPTLPVPGDEEAFHTGSGCVKFKAVETECTPTATSLASTI